MADVHVESPHRTCCNLVPFGLGGNFGSEREALRALVYVLRGRWCPRRVPHGPCDSARAVIAVTPDSGSAKWWCPGSAVAVKDIYRPYLSATLLAQS
jgi:hypothetical protein